MTTYRDNEFTDLAIRMAEATGDPDVTRDGQVEVAAAQARTLLTTLGIVCDDESTAATPRRFVRALLELTAGSRVDPDRHFERTFPPPGGDPGIIIVPGVPFTSLCEHHLLPFTGTITVGYLPAPGARIVGLSKLARAAREYAARPQMQERIGQQVTEAIGRRLQVHGAACVIRSVHACMTLRGARAGGAEMVTSHMTGMFRNSAELRTEFLALAGHR